MINTPDFNNRIEGRDLNAALLPQQKVKTNKNNIMNIPNFNNKIDIKEIKMKGWKYYG